MDRPRTRLGRALRPLSEDPPGRRHRIRHRGPHLARRSRDPLSSAVSNDRSPLATVKISSPAPPKRGTPSRSQPQQPSVTSCLLSKEKPSYDVMNRYENAVRNVCEGVDGPRERGLSSSTGPHAMMVWSDAPNFLIMRCRTGRRGALDLKFASAIWSADDRSLPSPPSFRAHGLQSSFALVFKVIWRTNKMDIRQI